MDSSSSTAASAFVYDGTNEQEIPEDVTCVKVANGVVRVHKEAFSCRQQLRTVELLNHADAGLNHADAGLNSEKANDDQTKP